MGRAFGTKIPPRITSGRDFSFYKVYKAYKLNRITCFLLL